MTEKRFERIAKFRDTYDDLPDGAFFALAEEQGISVDDWAWFAKQEEQRKAPASKRAEQ